MDESKPIWKSKTFIISSLAVLIALFTQLDQLLTSGQAITVMGVLTILLRAISKEAVRFTP